MSVRTVYLCLMVPATRVPTQVLIMAAHLLKLAANPIVCCVGFGSVVTKTAIGGIRPPLTRSPPESAVNGLFDAGRAQRALALP